MPATRSQLIAHVRTFVGVPYIHQGRSATGMDCFGPIAVGAEFLGVPYRNVPDYPRVGRPGGIREILSKYGTEILSHSRRPGDVGVFWFDRVTRADQHVGLFTDVGLLHCYGDVGKVVEHALSPRWEKRLLAVFRYPSPFLMD